jgi:hypothetical protein
MAHAGCEINPRRPDVATSVTPEIHLVPLEHRPPCREGFLLNASVK